MTAFDIAKWERCKELADMFGVKIEVRNNFKLTDKKGCMLGVLGTVAEVFAFLCGYEHSTHTGG
jgi:hypothetical protein